MFFFFFDLVLDLDQMWIRWTRSQHNENRRDRGLCSSKRCFKNHFSMKFMRTAHPREYQGILCCVVLHSVTRAGWKQLIPLYQEFTTCTCVGQEIQEFRMIRGICHNWGQEPPNFPDSIFNCYRIARLFSAHCYTALCHKKSASKL